MWHFRTMTRGEINDDPTEGDFFNVDALPNFADALVREAIQNSLDAGSDSPSSRVTVNIRISTDGEAIEYSRAQPFLDGLWPHAAAYDVISDLPPKGAPDSWIAVEDFETRGLVGNIYSSEDPSPGERNDFFYFWRIIGRGKKEGVYLHRKLLQEYFSECKPMIQARPGRRTEGPSI